MTDTQKTVIQHDVAELAKAAAAEKDRQDKLGHKEDGNVMILEMDQNSGAQTLISAPALNIPLKNADGTQATDPESGEPLYQWQALVFPHRTPAEEWVKERGERGFSYLILNAVHAMQGDRSPEELEAMAESDAAAMQEAIQQDQEDRKE